MANVTIATVDLWLPEIWATQTLENFTKNVVVLPLTDRRWEGLLKPGGDRVNVPDVDNVTARTLTSMTGTVTFDAATEGVTTIIVDKFIYFAFKVDSAAGAQAVLPLFEAYTDKAGKAIAIKVDTDILAEMGTTTNTKGVDNVAIGDDVVRDSRAVLDKNDNPMDDRHMAVSPDTLMDFYNIDRYSSNLYRASTGNLDMSKGRGYAGKIYEFDTYETTNLPSGAAGKKNFMWHRTGIAAIVQREMTVERRFPHDEFAEAMRVWTMYGVKLMRAASVVEIDGR